MNRVLVITNSNVRFLSWCYENHVESTDRNIRAITHPDRLRGLNADVVIFDPLWNVGKTPEWCEEMEMNVKIGRHIVIRPRS